jgi:tRNA dimethylallyltransferase
MFYYKILLDGLSPLPPSNTKLREYLSQKKHNQDTLHKKLKLIDPVSANRIHKNDFQRLLRALEVFYLSGKNLTTLIKEKKYKFPYTALQFAIIPPNKAWLHQKIEARIKKMLILGLQEEVELLFHRGDLHIDLPSIRCIGYRQMWEYLEYKISYQDMFNKIVYATKMLAKHQLTWLKKWKNVNILTYSSIYNVLIEKILNVFSKYNNKIL